MTIMRRYLAIIMMTSILCGGCGSTTAAPGQTADQSQGVEMSQTAETSQDVDKARTAETSQAADTARTAETPQDVDTARTAETSQAADTARTAETSQAADTAQMADTSQNADTAQTTRIDYNGMEVIVVATVPGEDYKVIFPDGREERFITDTPPIGVEQVTFGELPDDWQRYIMALYYMNE